jgi:hypothetical protein
MIYHRLILTFSINIRQNKFVLHSTFINYIINQFFFSAGFGCSMVFIEVYPAKGLGSFEASGAIINAGYAYKFFFTVSNFATYDCLFCMFFIFNPINDY